MLSKEELVSKLEAAVGDTAYGKALVNEAAETYGDKEKKYGYDMKDRLDVRLGVLKAYERIHKEDGEEAKATAEADKIAIVEKALKAIEE